MKNIVKQEEWILTAKNSLLERKKQLEELLADLAEIRPQESQGQDLGDQAFSSSIEALKNSLQDAEYREYQMILKALDAIDQGTYGVCVDCGKQIAERRLRSYPNAARCLPCQELFEERM